jgi:hypothetical protein
MSSHFDYQGDKKGFSLSSSSVLRRFDTLAHPAGPSGMMCDSKLFKFSSMAGDINFKNS